MRAGNFKGTGALARFVFRQQRFKILVWLAGLIGITLLVAAAYPSIYKDEHSKQAAFFTMENPAMVAMLGPGYEMEDYVQSVGAMFANEMLLFTVMAVAAMNILLVGRATRGDEEDGRIEMIRALSVGRLSHASAVLIVMVSANLVLAILTAAGLAVLGIEGIGLEGAALYGALLGASGLLFAAVTALFAQLAETSRGTAMFSFLFLIIAYLVRAIGDVSSDSLSWISPLGWVVRTEVFAANNWWPVLLLAAAAVLSGLAAFYLHAARDLGSGFIAPRRGKMHASPFLQTPFGLAFRLQRTNTVVWTIILFALSSSFGAILGDLESYFADNELMQAFVEADSAYTLTEQFITLLMAIMSVISLIPTVMVVLKLKSEETKNLTENFYSRAVSRNYVLGSYCLLSVLVSLTMQTAVAFGLWSVGGAVMDEGLSFTTTFSSAYVYLPAMWVVIGLAAALLGAAPKLTSLVWLYIIYCFVVVYLKDLLRFPEWMNQLSAFEHVPQIPVDEMNFVMLAVLTGGAILFLVVGFIGYNKRDLAG
ncbi:ABC transporter permease [Planomicrobium sp. YIM 101495]|uniref:ABC transporter permease n=1 Tax=Planomicrobium sp. YIM 101495 TaxID=2665160 RepID=UPI0012B8404A|nr:ABC transporter permease [Planomicrobium sp. YIM 101495]MTD31254.1 ABC transporter permease [Planomicrobium sp. YIM 101495]